MLCNFIKLIIVTNVTVLNRDSNDYCAEVITVTVVTIVTIGMTVSQ